MFAGEPGFGNMCYRGIKKRLPICSAGSGSLLTQETQSRTLKSGRCATSLQFLNLSHVPRHRVACISRATVFLEIWQVGSYLTRVDVKPYSYTLCVVDWLHIRPMRSSTPLPIPRAARCSTCCATETCRRAGSRRRFLYLALRFQSTCDSCGMPAWCASTGKAGNEFTI
jgi:hypothetical protein